MTDYPTRYLTCLDYGSGGIWRTIKAPRAAMITALYPELDVIDPDSLPEWMTADTYQDFLSDGRRLEEDIDQPGTFLQCIVADRIRALQLEGRLRHVFTVGFDDGTHVRWSWLWAHTEPEIRALYPELIIRHGRNDEWLAARRAEGTFDEETADISRPDAGVLGRVRARRRLSGNPGNIA